MSTWNRTLYFGAVVAAVARSCSDLEDRFDCFLPGSCDDGTFIGASFEASDDNCRALCENDSDCTWFTFYGKKSNGSGDGFICSLFSSCKKLRTEDESAVSGQKHCRKPNSFCWRSVECRGQVIKFELNTVTPEECLESCKGEQSCRYFNHDKTSRICVLMSTCPSYKSGCHGSCTSGQASCEEPAKAGNGLTKVFMSLGDGGNGRTIKTGFVVDFSDENARCDELPDYPHSVTNAVGGLVNGKITLCGGKEGATPRGECHQLEEGEWKSIRSLDRPRMFSASAVVAGGSDLLYVHGGLTDVGGFEENGVVVFDETSGVWNDTVGGTPFPLVSRHCMVMVDNTTLMTIGGWVANNLPYGADVWFHDLETREWYTGPPLLTGRNRHACGVMRQPNYRGSGKTQIAVVVAGGDTPIHQGRGSDTTEFLYVPEDFKRRRTFLTWRVGPVLQKAVVGGRIVESTNGNELYLIGGNDRNFYKSDKIYKLTFDSLDQFSRASFQPHLGSEDGGPVGYAWVEMDVKIPAGMSDHVAFLIPDNVTSCNTLL